MNRTTARLLAILVTTLVVGPGLVTTTLLTATPAHAEDTPGQLLLMLDASGSMAEKDPSGLTKMNAAKKALTTVVKGLPDDSTVGLRVYGATQPGGKPTQAACADTQLAVPITTIDKPALTSAINGFRAKGETPIAGSLTAALKDLGTEGKRNIVLVSDGEESCVPDPCPVIKKLLTTGIDLQIDTVGFSVNSTARKQLQCIADAGNGSYYDAKDADTLTTSLTKLSTRALRPFTVSGTPVRLSDDTTKAPELGPGQYVDSFIGQGAPRYGRITRTPGSTLRVAVMARPPASASNTDAERWTVTITTPDGASCARQSEGAIQFYRDGATVVATSVNSRAGSARTGSDEERCAQSPDLLLAVARDEGDTAAQPAEILVMEEPPVTDLASLPAGLTQDEVASLVAERSGAGAPVVGGGSFSDSLELGPGTYQDVLVGDEQLFYRVRLEQGQRAAFTADVPAPGTSGQQPSSSSVLFGVEAYTPARVSLSRVLGKKTPDNQVQLRSGIDRGVAGEFTPEVRYRNREALGGNGYSVGALRATSIPGYYYFAISRDSSLQEDELRGQPIPIRFAITVEGEPSGQPEYAEGGTGYASGTPTGSPTSTAPPTTTSPTTTGPDAAGQARDDDGGAPVLLLVGGVALVGLVGVGTALWLRSRRRQEGGTSHA